MEEITDVLLAPPQRVRFVSDDGLGRDMFRRMVFGARVSLSIGLIGVVLSFLLGIGIGGASGYFGGATDVVVQRLIEFIRSIPVLPLWMAVAPRCRCTGRPSGSTSASPSSAPDPVVSELRHRGPDPQRAIDDPGRDLAELPRRWGADAPTC